MADIIDVMYRLRDMAGLAADELRDAIDKAQKVLDRLDYFANDAEEGVELIAASDLHPTVSANIPPRSGLVRKDAGQGSETFADRMSRQSLEALKSQGGRS